MIDFDPSAVRLFHQSESERKLGEVVNAKKLLQETLRHEPRMPGAWFNLGNDFHNEKKKVAAVACFRRALELVPDEFHCLVNLGWNLQQLGKSAEAIIPMLKASELNPNDPKPLMNLCLAYSSLGSLEIAIECGRGATFHGPHDPINHMALAFALMLNGEYKEGLEEYEWRFPYKMREYLTYPMPKWDGTPVDHLFIAGEQGFGDVIQFGRYIPLAAKRCRHVTVCIHEEIVPIVLAAKIPNVTVVPMPSHVPDCQAYCPIMSLPVALGLSDHDIPRVESNWFADHFHLIKPAPQEGRKKVGIVWSGSPEQDNNEHRSCRLEDLFELYKVPGIQLYSFQIGDRAADCRGYDPLVQDLSKRVRDFADTASMMVQMDAMVTVCTSSAHLAGALGVPVHIMLPKRGQHFIWGISDKTTPWYPSARLYRQHKMGDWSWVIDEIAESL